MAAAFGLDVDWMTWVPFGQLCQAAVLPHPSGRNRWYNDPNNKAAVSDFLRAVVYEETGKWPR